MPEPRWLPHPQVAVQPDGEGAILLHLRTNRYFELNATGLRVWQRLADREPPDAIARALAAEFEVEPQAAREAVDELMAELAAEGLIVEPGGGQGVRAWVSRMLRRTPR